MGRIVAKLTSNAQIVKSDGCPLHSWCEISTQPAVAGVGGQSPDSPVLRIIHRDRSWLSPLHVNRAQTPDAEKGGVPGPWPRGLLAYQLCCLAINSRTLGTRLHPPPMPRLRSVLRSGQGPAVPCPHPIRLEICSGSLTFLLSAPAIRRKRLPGMLVSRDPKYAVRLGIWNIDDPRVSARSCLAQCNPGTLAARPALADTENPDGLPSVYSLSSHASSSGARGDTTTISSPVVGCPNSMRCACRK